MNKKSLINSIIFFIIFSFSISMMYRAQSQFKTLYPSTSISFREALTEKQADELKHYKGNVSLTLWGEENVQVRNAYVGTDTIAVIYDGSISSIRSFKLLDENAKNNRLIGMSGESGNIEDSSSVGMSDKNGVVEDSSSVGMSDKNGVVEDSSSVGMSDKNGSVENNSSVSMLDESGNSVDNGLIEISDEQDDVDNWNNQILISDHLAMDLWGSSDIVGQDMKVLFDSNLSFEEVEYDGGFYDTSLDERIQYTINNSNSIRDGYKIKITGVIASDQNVIYIPASCVQNRWKVTNIELQSNDPQADNPAALANELIQLNGLEGEYGIYYGREIAAMMFGASLVPLLLLIWKLLRMIWEALSGPFEKKLIEKQLTEKQSGAVLLSEKQVRIKRISSQGSGGVYNKLRKLTSLFTWGSIHPGWLVGLLAAFLIPILATQLPGWMIPARWSDFDFWIQMAESAGTRTEEMFRMMPSVRELEGQWCIVRWMIGWGIAVLIS